jgi:hypothetical protein
MGKPESGESFTLTLPEELQGSGLPDVLNTWSRSNEDEVLSWLNQLTPETRDRIVSNYCAYDRHEEPLDLAVLAMAIKSVRDQSLRNLMHNWLAESREEAVEDLNDLDLSEAGPRISH